MPPLVDLALSRGAAFHAEVAHGERVTVLTGPDAGLTFIGIQEIESDLVLDTVLGEDRRSKRILRFRNGQVPNLGPQAQVRTEDGRKWHAVREPGNVYLTTDFELREIAPGKDT